MPHDFRKVDDNNLQVTYQHPELDVEVAAGKAPNMDNWRVKVRGADVNPRSLGMQPNKNAAKDRMQRFMKSFNGREDVIGLGGHSTQKPQNNSVFDVF